MPCFDEETFGPVLSLTEVSSEEEALQLANRTEYGLGGCVFTRDAERGERFALRLNAGMVALFFFPCRLMQGTLLLMTCAV